LRDGILTSVGMVAVITATLLAMPSTLHASEYQDHESIRQAAKAFVGRQLARHGQHRTIEIGRLDSRLRLAPCDRPLESFRAPGARDVGNTTVGVRCTGAKPWTLYVPALIRIYDAVLVTARPIPRGATLTPHDIRLESRDVAHLREGVLVDPEQAVGQVTRRPLEMGEVLSPAAVKPARLVHRGEKVTILAQGNRLEVRATGEALADGAAGEPIRVRNLLTKKIIHGVVAGSGLVQVRM
jgi:flagellar basal body P-ring formation protein FlgA